MAADEVKPDPFAIVGLDLAALLAPLADGDGAGDDMRYTPELDAIAKARLQEDETNQGIWQTDAKKADWQEVVKLCAEILTTRSKDLQVAAWLTEGLINLHGLNGIAVGLELVAQLTTNFWKSVWPRPEEDDLEPRLAPYYWLDTRLDPVLLRLAVSEPTDESRNGLTYHQVVRARRLHQIGSNNSKAYQEALADGETSFETIEHGFAMTSDTFFQARANESRLAMESMTHLVQALGKVAGGEAPSFATLKKTLGDIDRMFAQENSTRGHQDSPMEEVPTQDVDDNTENVTVEKGSAPAGYPALTNRRAAYALLDHAADWLLRYEPHSPVPYLVKRAVSWENRSLRDVLAELMQRGADRETIFEVLGMDEFSAGAASGAPRSRNSGKSPVRE